MSVAACVRVCVCVVPSDIRELPPCDVIRVARQPHWGFPATGVIGNIPLRDPRLPSSMNHHGSLRERQLAPSLRHYVLPVLECTSSLKHPVLFKIRQSELSVWFCHVPPTHIRRNPHDSFSYRRSYGNEDLQNSVASGAGDAACLRARSLCRLVSAGKANT